MTKPAQDLFAAPLPFSGESKPATPSRPAQSGSTSYDASSIEVLEGLEPVRRRPGMYIGGTDERALHHLFAEILDNAMDEVIGGHATRVEVDVLPDGSISVSDNGRGIPVDPHPRFPDKSALEVILTTLHSGGKFGGDAYEASGGLHGVGISVVNALAEQLDVSIVRSGTLYTQTYKQGHAVTTLNQQPAGRRSRGTTVRFKPDATIFTRGTAFEPARLYKMIEAKASLLSGVEVRWRCDPSLLKEGSAVPQEGTLCFPGGLQDRLASVLKDKDVVTDSAFCGQALKRGQHGALEWAISWTTDFDGMVASFCNTIPTHDGGTHELAARMALLRALRSHAERVGNKRFANVTSDDVLRGIVMFLSLYMKEPEFQGQTKEKLASSEASKLVEGPLKDACDHWLASSPQQAARLIDALCDYADERLRARAERDLAKKVTTKRLRLPGKLADATQNGPKGLELFLVEGDSAGGSAKQARDRKYQAILPLRGKILNVASAADGKLQQNQQLLDLVQAMGCGTGKSFKLQDLRYEKIIIMTDADVDGAHIASLLITFFWLEMPELIHKGHLYLAVPPLYRLSDGKKTIFARDDKHKDQLIKEVFKNKKDIEIGRFKGLGEMMPQQLRETTMDPTNRTFLKVNLGEEPASSINTLIDQLMGSKADSRFRFIQERAQFAKEIDI
jgi:topoisomerase IV subunit B